MSAQSATGPASAANPLRLGAQATAGMARRFGALLRPIAAAPAALSVPTGCVLCVDAGLHRGASLRLRYPRVRIGSAADNDIVLRDDGVAQRHAELRRVDGSWALYAAAGGAAQAPLESVRRAAFLRQRYAIGAASVVVSQVSRAGAELSAPPRWRWQQAVAPGLFVLAAVLGAAVIVQLVKPAAASVVVGAQNLAAEGWPDVRVVVDAAHRTQVSGHVDTAEAYARLQRWLPEHGHASASLNVRVGSELAARVREALADESLTVRYLPGGTVRVEGSTTQLATRTQIQRLRTDLAGAVAIDDQVAYSEAAEAPKPRPLPVRIVSVMPGEFASFTTDSGGRYFVGAVLSDGAEVAAINADGIEFKIGQKSVNYPLK